ncbi:MAG: response regulator [Fuerstiella sp.]|jgi:CheY-like chemotaxis protein
MSVSESAILVAEDNRVMANVIRFNLQRAGFDVTLVHDGQSAVAALRNARFDLVITDYQMPHASGEDICRFVRTESSWPDIPVVLVSAKGIELQTGDLIGPHRFTQVVYKPFSPKEIVRIASEVLATAMQA